MLSYYELHVTFVDPNFTNEPDNSRSWVSREPKIRGWKFSRIDGDPTLGAGVKSYLTRQYPARLPMAEVVGHLEFCARKLHELGYRVLRQKVELVLYDKRSKA